MKNSNPIALGKTPNQYQLQRLEQILREHADSILGHATAVVTAISVGDRTTLIQPAGHLDETRSEPVNESTIFDLLSLTKAIVTAPLAFILQEKGLLSLDEPVSKLLPEFSGQGRDAILLKHLLAHAAGLSDIDLEFDHSDPTLAWRRMLASPLHYNPGDACEYSDLSYRILGRALEIAGGASLDQLASSLLFEPLGLHDTCFNPSATLRSRIAGRGALRGCTEDSQVLALGGVAGCDGVFSTAADLLSFGRMMLRFGTTRDNERILTRKSVLTMTQQQSIHPEADRLVVDAMTYLAFGAKSYGWELPGQHSHGGNLLSKGAFGKAGGVGSFLWIDTELGIVCVILTNYGFPWPFTAEAWNKLVGDLNPGKMLNNVVEVLS